MLTDLVQLRTFVAVAEEQHLTRGADRLHISLSAASAHIRALEESLDVQLFVRANRGLQLTHAGELLLREAEKLLNQAGLFSSFARELAGKMEGNLVVGSNSEVGTRIGDVIRALRASHPLVTVDLHARPSSGTRQGLKSGELDVGVFLGRPIDAGFTYYELTIMQYRVAGPAAWKAQIERADWAELASLPWITPMSSSAYADMLAGLFVARGLKLNTVVRFDSAAHARAMLQTAIAMMLMRDDHAVQGERDGYLAVSPIARAEIPLLIAHLSSRQNDPLIAAFVEAAKVAWPEVKLTAINVRG
jgi:DNA-binding transcriptional LysR family regulator